MVEASLLQGNDPASVGKWFLMFSYDQLPTDAVSHSRRTESSTFHSYESKVQVERYRN